jgi:predicted phosphohydrolase
MDLQVDSVDVLIAAGDIDVGLAGLEWLKQLPCKVVYVAGNHEYWGEELQDLIGCMAESARQGNICFLENESVAIDNVRFLGCTLWSDFAGANASIMNEMILAMNDFYHISKGANLIRPSDLVTVNTLSRRWLEQELRQPFAGKTVVVTHHAPLMRSWYDDKDDAIQYGYCNDLTLLMREYEIDLWVHGHVHAVFDYMAHGVRVVCNPRGYFGYKEVSDFDSGKRIVL